MIVPRVTVTDRSHTREISRSEEIDLTSHQRCDWCDKVALPGEYKVSPARIAQLTDGTCQFQFKVTCDICSRRMAPDLRRQCPHCFSIIATSYLTKRCPTHCPFCRGFIAEL